MRLVATMIGAAALAQGVVACASFPRPQERLEASRAALAAAEAVDAEQDPRGALHLQLAREQVDKAKTLIEDGKNAEADYVLQRAQSDAELAVAYAKRGPAQEAANDVQEELNELKGRNEQSR